MKRISIKGVVVGNVVDIVATNVIVLPVAMYVLISLGTSKDAVESVHQVMKSNGVFWVSLVWGALCSVLGGYVSARIADHDHVLNGALSSILCVGLGVHALVVGSAASDAVLHLIFLPLSPMLGALGGFVRSRRLKRSPS